MHYKWQFGHLNISKELTAKPQKRKDYLIYNLPEQNDTNDDSIYIPVNNPITEYSYQSQIQRSSSDQNSKKSKIHKFIF